MGCIIKGFIYYLIWNFWLFVSSIISGIGIGIIAVFIIDFSELDEDSVFLIFFPFAIFIMIFPFYIMTRKWHKRNLRKIFSSKNSWLALFAFDTPIPVEKNNSDKDLSKDK